jgi:hypothetical protein
MNIAAFEVGELGKLGELGKGCWDRERGIFGSGHSIEKSAPYRTRPSLRATERDAGLSQEVL